MNNLTNKKWWIAAGIRALKTICQTAVVELGANTAGIIAVNWIGLFSVAGLAGIASLLTSIAGLPEVDENEV